jgi:hypothetical protein
MSVDFRRTTRRYIPEYRILHNHRSQILDTHDFMRISLRITTSACDIFEQLLHLTKSTARRFGRTVNISDSYLIGAGLDSRARLPAILTSLHGLLTPYKQMFGLTVTPQILPYFSNFLIPSTALSFDVA